MHWGTWAHSCIFEVYLKPPWLLLCVGGGIGGIDINGEEHIEFEHHNVSSNGMNEGKWEYAKFGKVGLKNQIGLSHRNILQKVTKGLINGQDFEWRNIWVCVLLARYFICVKVENFIHFLHGWFLWSPWDGSWKGCFPFGDLWWILMTLKWRAFEMCFLTLSHMYPTWSTHCPTNCSWS